MITWAHLPGRFVYSEVPCPSCGEQLVLNGPALAEDLDAFRAGEACLNEYVCVRCPEHWGFYGARHPESPTFEELVEAVSS